MTCSGDYLLFQVNLHSGDISYIHYQNIRGMFICIYVEAHIVL